MGELFSSPHEWTPLISERLIDYMRMPLANGRLHAGAQSRAWARSSCKDGLAWSRDVSPIGHAANVTLELVCYNFGIQEYSAFNERHAKCRRLSRDEEWIPVISEKPGWGIGR